jgi:hypothetical protein
MVSISGRSAVADDHGRIKRPPPTPTEAERIASDMAMNDGSLQKGDIVSTDHGFFSLPGPGRRRNHQRFRAGAEPLIVQGTDKSASA